MTDERQRATNSQTNIYEQVRRLNEEAKKEVERTYSETEVRFTQEEYTGETVVNASSKGYSVKVTPDRRTDMRDYWRNPIFLIEGKIFPEMGDRELTVEEMKKLRIGIREENGLLKQVYFETPTEFHRVIL